MDLFTQLSLLKLEVLYELTVRDNPEVEVAGIFNGRFAGGRRFLACRRGHYGGRES
jgi:hypothetical protein